ncbi:Multicopper oxidase [Actinacidiphila rubida]|uniref:Multicopper oxidase n=2 Tax=Actinacidiphila rubida TaxID=310780 RepID=A0A1H8I1U6_9ACTN|nr:multicopper oxidase domain-containing protein [Actinacidiphila rubida]SEN62294.1 Multicopper oxidase [Actinacidiphila rubida]
MASDPASDPASAPVPAPASAPADDPRPGSGRRNLLRALTGGGALAALSLTAAPQASAAARPAPTRPAGRPAADPFTLDRFAPTGRLREYWVQADSFPHNAVPNGHDMMTGAKFTADQTTFQAIGFRAYSPGWGSPLPADFGPEGIGANSGIPGPVLRGHVGDTIRVHFRNNDAHYKWPHSMHPHGVRYSPGSDGGWMADTPDKPGTAVPYKGSYTYTWQCTPGSVGSWPYHDHSTPQAPPRPSGGGSPQGAQGAQSTQGTKDAHGAPPGGDAQAAPGGAVAEIGATLGLFGMIAVTDDRTPQVDREFVLFFHDVSPGEAPSVKGELSLCNGGAFVGNAPTYTARTGERVRWRVGTLGNSFHVFHIHGHRWLSAAGWVDSQVLGPATTLTVEYTEDNPGDWLYHCHLPGHMSRGMAGGYTVTG